MRKGRLIAGLVLLVIIVIPLAYVLSASAADAQRTAEYRAAAEQALAEEKTRLDPIIERAHNDCQPLGENVSTCLAEIAVTLEKYGSGVYKFSPDSPNNYTHDGFEYFADKLCDFAGNDSDFCYFYVAVKAYDSDFCSKMKQYQIGCEILSSNTLCDGVGNIYECMSDRAYFLRYTDKNVSLSLCTYIKNRLTEPVGYDSLSCDDINFGEKESDSWSYSERVQIIYALMRLTDFRVETRRG